MSVLPTLSLPHYEAVLPSNKNIIYRFRPYVLKEEKLLLMTNLSNDKTEFAKAIRRVLVDCSLNSEFTDEFVEKLSYFDIEYLFLILRARSVGEVQEVEYTCNNLVDDKVCDHKVKVAVDFTKLEVEIPEGHSNVIKLTDDITLTLKYPSIDYLEAYSTKLQQMDTEDSDVFQTSLEYLAGLIETVVTPDGVISRKDFNQEEGVEWLENLTEEAFKKIQEGYLDKFPRIILKSHFHCGKCGYNQDLTLEGLESFFD